MLAGKELNTEQLVDTTFWLKPWLKSISFSSNFFNLAKVLATTKDLGQSPIQSAQILTACGEDNA